MVDISYFNQNRRRKNLAMKPALVVESVSKKYSRNFHTHREYGLSDLLREICGLEHRSSLRKDEFWAVKDISFTLYPGDCLGLIGKNGSGKSTLLKMLNGLIKQDTGKIMVDGRVQALINLGAGFDPSLTGKENIFNSAALMGLGYRETRKFLGEIIEFSELDEFIDSPVGTYSSGMYARLGFSVAIHLNPTIILIDEILAVGDHAFKNKCFTKMHQLKKKKVTMVIVSHNTAHILQLCDYGLWLHQGQSMKFGKAEDVVKNYLSFLDQEDIKKSKLSNSSPNISETKSNSSNRFQLYGAIYNDLDRIEKLETTLLADDGHGDCFKAGGSGKIRYAFDLKEEVTNLNVSLNIFRKDGLLMTTISTLNGNHLKNKNKGRVTCEVDLAKIPLNPGDYVLVLAVHEGHSYLYRDIVKEFKVINNHDLTWGVMNFEYHYHVIE